MKTFLQSILSSFFLMFAISTTMQTQTPRTMSIQGCLIDASTGRPYQNGRYQITVKIFDTLTDGTPLDSFSFDTVWVTDGIFGVVIGPINSSLDFNEQYWISISVEGKELFPRTPLTASPYALSIDNSAAVTELQVGLTRLTGDIIIKEDNDITVTYKAPDTIVIGRTAGSGGPITDVISSSGKIAIMNPFVSTFDLDIATGAVTTNEILNETITKDDIGNDAVGTEEIVSESILASDIATGAVTTNEILNETILSEDIFDSSIQSVDFADGSVTTPKIADNAVNSAKILDGDVQTIDIADAAVTTSKINSGAVTQLKLAPDAVGTKASSTINYESLTAGAFANSLIGVSGAQLGDIVVLGVPNSAMTQGGSPIDVTYTAWVSAIGTVTIRCKNRSTTAVDPDAGTFNVMVIPAP